MNIVNMLVVEDDPDGQEVVTRMLRYHKIKADMVSTGEQALKLLATHPYSAVIIDLSLPGMDGWTLLENIKAQALTTHLPCVAITAFHSPELIMKAIEAGFIAYFPKPLDAGSFVKELQRVLQ